MPELLIKLDADLHGFINRKAAMDRKSIEKTLNEILLQGCKEFGFERKLTKENIS